MSVEHLNSPTGAWVYTANVTIRVFTGIEIINDDNPIFCYILFIYSANKAFPPRRRKVAVSS